MTVASRLLEAIEATKLSQAALGRALGVSRGAVNQWRRGDIKNLRNENLLGLADLSGYAVRWIVNGHGPKFAPKMDDTMLELMDAIAELTEEQRREVLDFAKFKRRTESQVM